MLKNDINKYNKPSEELLQRISLGENQCQDFKFAITDSKKIAKSLSAFANTDGGSLLIGVKDNGKIAGANIDEEYYMIERRKQKIRFGNYYPKRHKTALQSKGRKRTVFNLCESQ